MNKDLAGKEYWDESWLVGEIPLPVDPQDLGVNNYTNFTNRRFHEYFHKIFSGLDNRGLRLLEIGCARSVWLPYFAKEFGFKVYGIDYSEVGCQQARQILSKAAVEGEVVCADFFSPPTTMLETFDVVVSFGVAEHFEDTKNCIIQFSKFIKPDGMMITIIPNLTGWFGSLQKTFNIEVYKVHVIRSVQEFRLAHIQANMKVLECNYFISQSLALVSLKGLNPNQVGTRLKILAQLFLILLAQLIWLFEDYVKPLPVTAMLSPYIVCVAQKDVLNSDNNNE
jgi:2-polyprenyl-3-methyl-5-hydroxy-6-metoxy-1,4-benzoquinol methylase